MVIRVAASDWCASRSTVSVIKTFDIFKKVVGPNSKKYEYRPIRQINPLLSVELEEIIDKCVAISPSARYGSCEDLAKELKNSI